MQLKVDQLLDHSYIRVVEIVAHRHETSVGQAPAEAPGADLGIKFEEEVAVDSFFSEYG